MKKKVLIIIGVLLLLIAILIGLYFYGLTPVSKSSKSVEFKINTGDSKIDIVDNLDNAGLIKFKISAYIYVSLNRHLNLQAGNYKLAPNMSLKDILNKINKGDISNNDNIYTITFVEGKRLTDYAEIIAQKTNTKVEDVLKVLNDKNFIKELMPNYWFLTDNIFNNKIYYPLEGYLYPSTYEFYKDSTIKDIIIKMLDATNDVLTPFQKSIENNSYNVHQILTLASIIELEGSDDRAGVAGVFYNRLKANWTLGSDVTTYYAVKKSFSEDLTTNDLNSCNGYNTRGNCVSGLPVGPICSPSKSSIEAAINPSKHDYYFFVADKNKKTYFTKTSSEHEAKVNELKNNGLWYEYN